MEMRLVFTIIAFSSVFTVVANASIGTRQTLAACTVNCLGKANLGGCTLQDYVCLCKSQPYIQSMASCIDATCDSADIAAARVYSQSVCNSVGVSLVNSATVTGSSATNSAAAGASPTGSDTNRPASSKSANSLPIGAIVGGAVGGVVVLAAMGIALFIYIRKTRDKVQVNPNPEVKPFVSSDGQDDESQMQSHASLLHTAPSTISGTISVPTQFVTDTSTIYPPSSPVSHVPSESAETRMTVESSPSVARSSSPSAPVPGPGGQLAVEQLVTLQTLYNLDMPAAEIAGVMDRMRFEQQQVTEDDSRSGFAHGNAMRDPPSYDTPTSRTLGGVESARVEQQISGEGSSGLVRGDTKPDPPMYDFKDA